MRSYTFTYMIKKALFAATILLCAGAGSAVAQQQINLSAGPTTAALPDGSTVPMWGYSCSPVVVSGSTATCAKSNPAATGWSPVVITVPTGQDLQINLTNNLVFGAGPIPTSLTIVGQLGGGLGSGGTTAASPAHAQLGVTWPTANTGAKFTPPAQGPRVQSFGTEVAAGSTSALTWTKPRPGTYLLESGTHPSIQASMGLIGVVVVTGAPTVDPITGLIETAAGTAYPGITYDADVPLIFSEIDPVQNKAVSTAVNTAGFNESTVWSGQPGGCGNPSSAVGVINTCYPPVVNYTPLYYLINGVALDKTNVAGSLFPASPVTLANLANPSGNVLVRMVNAGSRMHVPAIVGSQIGTAGGFSLIAEDGNPLPGVPRVQNEVFMAAGKTYDVMINAPPSGGKALPVYDRELSLSGNATSRDAGMLAYIGINGSGPGLGNVSATANPDTYNSVIAGQTLTVSDPGKGVIANDINVYGVKVTTAPTQGNLTLNADGTFTYVANAGWTGGDSFVYQANGNGPSATVTLGKAPMEAASGITCGALGFSSKVATTLKINPPGVLAGCTDAAGYLLSVGGATAATPLSVPLTGPGTGTATLDPNGGFRASVSAAGTYTFSVNALNSQGTVSSSAATVTLTFPTASNLVVTVLDGADKTTKITDYRWIIEEDQTFFMDPKCISNPLPAGCPAINAAGAPPIFGTNFHTSNMPVIATGCTGTLSCEAGQTIQNSNVVCDQGNGVCRPDPTGNGQTSLDPGQVYLDPTKRYYISVFPGDAAQPFIAGYAGAPDCTTPGHCGHGMGGAPISMGQLSVMVLSQPSPFPPATLSVFVFEDDYPMNGEHDAGGGVDILSPNEPGLGGFQITLDDSAGGTGDPTGTPTYDMFNQPLTNSLAGTIDPSTGKDACPISASSRVGKNAATGAPGAVSATGITGMIVTCPKYEADGKTLSPLAGQAVVNNLYPGRYGVIAHPGADRIAQGEEWLQTNTLDGQKAHDSFMRIGEPGYFQEFGPAGFHVTIGFANPKVINSRLAGICAASGTTCANEVKGRVSTARMSRTPDERLYGSGSHDSYAFTQCYASLGDPDGADFAFSKCDKDGQFDFTGIPKGNWKVTLFDQWNDQVVDGISTPVGLSGTSATVDMGEVAVHQWQANFFTRTFLDQNGTGISTTADPGLALVKTNVRFPDGSFSNRNNTDLNGVAAFNEEFPLFNWYVIETDSTRYKNTGTHIVYDAGGPTDGTPGGGTSTIAKFFANTQEAIPLPSKLRVPGAVYCDKADCDGFSIATGPISGGSSGPDPATGTLSTGRIDPPWVETEGWQGFSGQNNFLEFGKKAYAAGETGGIHGHVIYSSTRPFDDPQFGTQNVWEPLVPNVTINLYKEGTAPDGTTSLTLIDTTQTSSFDKWAQGFRSDGIPNMNCPGQSTTDPFFYGLKDQPNYLDWYNSQHGGPAVTPLPNNSQFKCYDGMHNWNQLQPAPYDGMYQFPSVTGMDPATGKPTGTNCTACILNPDASDPYRKGLPMLPAGKYVTEVVVPPGFDLVKEEDKNILIGDNFIAPVTQEFGGLGNIFILPDQASVAAGYNANSAQNATNSLGRYPTLTSHEGDTPTVDTFWPCVGATRIVPDHISLFPLSNQVAPFAGATRNLCDRKEVTLDDQTSAQAEFFVWTQTHIASKFTGVITDDFDAEFDPFSPQFGEKFAPAFLPVSIKDWAGNEVSRTYTDEFGIYNGMNYSTWEVNPPNPTGYAPTMMVTCMNDPGTGITPDPLFQPGYSNFCYELPFMPGATGYFDTPVVPTSAFAGGYNHPDCAYPDATPAIASVTSSDIAGPWVSAAGHTLTITALGDQNVENYGYSGPDITNPDFNKQKVKRHYGFGGTAGTVTIGGVKVDPTTISWSDTSISLTVPSGVPDCAIQQQAQYGGSKAQCGQLQITAANGQQSVDTVTVTIGGKTPTVLTAGNTIQSAVDSAKPGDMIIVPPGSYKEMLIMWKPVRLQGVGAVSSVIDANPHPAGKLDPWRRQIVCLFGLALNGTPNNGTTNPYDPTNAFSCTDAMKFSVDRMPLEATVGWDASLNGNLAEQLIEPSLMGAYEGAGITVLSKGVKFNTTDPAVIWASDAFPTGTALLTASDCADTGTNPYPSNFWCNPSRIDGLSVTNSSQGGGGILVHGWGHNLEIANNRVHSNQGTLSGGITVGQGEHPDLYLAGGVATTVPGSCENSSITNQGLPYCFDLNVNLHNNAVTVNSSLGDELFSSTPAGAGGVTICNGSDYYKFKYNWVCGNMSSGDGAGVAHLGFTKNGDIEHNSILFNQSANPSITTNGGGLLVMGAPDQDPPCNTPVGQPANDNDCVSAPNLLTPSDGTGPGLTINANLIMGNSADSGSGGGLRLQHVNGTDVLNFPNGAVSCATADTCLWNTVSVTNNIITNNVAGWDGGGVSLQDALAVSIINNTIASNDSTASAGPLFGSLFAPLASTPGTNCNNATNDQSCPQVAGLVSVTNSDVLTANLPATVTCPPGHGISGSCKSFSVPILENNLIWQNRSFVVGVSTTTTNTAQYQNNVIALYNSSFTGTSTTFAASQPSVKSTAANGSGVLITGGTGACTAASYWDIGVRGDSGPSNHSGGLLSPTYSVLTDAGDYSGANNTLSNPTLLSQYCNGSRVPPELGTMGYMTTPGTNESNALPHPVFSLTPSATVDEGNNWVNLRWGPLSLTSPVGNTTLANSGPASGSPADFYVPPTAPTWAPAPSNDFYGNPRKVDNAAVDVGAVAFVYPVPTLTSVVPSQGNRGMNVNVTFTGTGLFGANKLVSGNGSITASNITPSADGTTVTATLIISSVAPVGAVNLAIITPGGTSNRLSFLVTTPTVTGISPASGYQGTIVPVTIAGNHLTGATGITPSNNSGITVGNFVVVNDTTITATLTIAGNATLGLARLSVAFPGGTIQSEPFASFTVVRPTLSTIAPNSGVRGTSISVTLTGHGLTGTTTVGASIPTSVTATNVVAVNDTTVTATLTIAANAPVGSVTIFARNGGGGTSTTVPFTVTVSTLAKVSPNTGILGTSVGVTFTGTGLAGTTAVASSGTGITATNIVASDTTVTATLTIAANASIGNQTLTLKNAGGALSTGTPVAFTVLVPSLTSITPTIGVRGATVQITLNGNNLSATSAVSFASGTGVTVTGLTVVSNTQLTATLTISSATTALGTHNIRASTAGGAFTNTEVFTVNNPTVTAIAPKQGMQGTSVNVTLTGTGLFGTTGITVTGTGVSATTFTAVSDTQVNATLLITAGATSGLHNITVTTAGGAVTPNPVQFTVIAPILTTVAPGSILQGATVPVTLTGSGLTGATGITVAGGGVTVTGFTAVSDTKITATFGVATGATVGNHAVTVSFPGGISSTASRITVTTPTLTTITPNTGGVAGASVNVTLTGSGLTGATVNATGATGVSVTSFAVVSDTQVTATLAISPNAAAGYRGITVTIPGGATSNSLAFLVTVPTLTRLSPGAGTHGTSVNMTLTGTSLLGATAVNVTGGGVTCTITGITGTQTATTVNATCAITSGAATGNRSLSITTTGNATTGGLRFTVN